MLTKTETNATPAGLEAVTYARGHHGWFHKVDHWHNEEPVGVCGQQILPWELLSRTPWEALICPACKKHGARHAV
jgi:hypothetical protein